MEQKKKEKDVLIVRDEKAGEISVVAGLDKDGNPKRTPAKTENAQDFLQFDRHGDVLDNFFKNFVGSARNPAASVFTVWRSIDSVTNLLQICDSEGPQEIKKGPEEYKSLEIKMI